MTLAPTTTDVSEEAGALSTPFRAPVNLAADERGSIHDDATAQKLGFRGGTVAGSIHMEQFPPLLLHAFGERWFETGTLSCYFRNATLHGERVQPFAGRPAGAADEQVRIWMSRDDGMLVLEGTASVGHPSEPTALRARLASPPPRGETRILEHLTVGTRTGRYPARLDLAQEARRIEAITEPLHWYSGDSPWGGPILNPGLAVQILAEAQQGLGFRHRAVGLFGAIEVRHINGPIFADCDYEVSAEILGVGETPKSEYVWYESTLHDGETEVAAMIMMLRFMKASSALWR